MEWIIKRAYKLLPKRITIFISEDLMRKVIKYLYEKLKDCLDDGKVDNIFAIYDLISKVRKT